jgi:hypothetical protein
VGGKSLTKTLVPVMGQEGCLGHLLHTCKGWRACDLEDRELGTFTTEAAASAAVLQASEGDAPRPPLEYAHR